MNDPLGLIVEEAANTARNPQDVVPQRDGKTYDHARDGKRLAAQHHRVLSFMRDQRWHTLAEIAVFTRDPEASVSARLRDLRKARFGSYNIQREYVERGLFRYRLLLQPELELQ